MTELLVDTNAGLDPAAIDDAEGLTAESVSPGRLALRRYRRHRAAMVSTVTLIIVAAACFLAPVIAPFGENEATGSENLFKSPDGTYLFGSDSLGRDLLSRILYGGQVSLLVGIFSAVSAGIIGTLIGAISGYRGGRLDNFLMRITDLFIGLPLLVMLLVIIQLPKTQSWASTVLGESGSVRLMVTVITLVSWMVTARIVRGVVLGLKEKEFVEAARAIGASDWHIISRHLIPNTIGPIVVAMTFIVAGAIGLEATLSFLGFGIDPLEASWGTLLSNAQEYVTAKKWWLIVFPSAVLLITIMCVNFIGDGLRDALDPKQDRQL